MLVSSTLLVALSLVQATTSKPAIARTDALKLRTAFAEALADSSPKARGKVLAQAKSLEAKHSLASLLDALRDGPLVPSGEPKPRTVGKEKEKLERIGNVVAGFTFASGAHTYRYMVDVPARYDGKRAVALIVDPGHGSGKKHDAAGKAEFLPYFRRAADGAGMSDALVVRTEIVEQIGGDGVRGASPDEELALVFDDFFRDVLSRFAIDVDRIYAGGISQTGYYSWYLGRARPDRLAGIAPLASVTWHVDKYLDCFANLPIYAAHGSDDAVCPIAQPRKTFAELERRAFPVRYVEVEGAGHDGAVFGRIEEGLKWLAERPRDPWPKHVRRAFSSAKNPHAYWLRVTKLDSETDGTAGKPPVATLSAKVDGQTIAIEASGVRSLELSLSAALLDLEQDVVVTWNGKRVHAGRLERSFVHAVEVALDEADWRGAGEAALALTAPK